MQPHCFGRKNKEEDCHCIVGYFTIWEHKTKTLFFIIYQCPVTYLTHRHGSSAVIEVIITIVKHEIVDSLFDDISSSSSRSSPGWLRWWLYSTHCSRRMWVRGWCWAMSRSFVVFRRTDGEHFLSCCSTHHAHCVSCISVWLQTVVLFIYMYTYEEYN